MPSAQLKVKCKKCTKDFWELEKLMFCASIHLLSWKNPMHGFCLLGKGLFFSNGVPAPCEGGWNPI